MRIQPLWGITLPSGSTSNEEILEQISVRKKSSFVVTTDTSIGNEWKAVIVSWVRSNAEGKIGFLNDFTRDNVALSRPADNSIQIGDFSNTISRARNEEIAGMVPLWFEISNETLYEMYNDKHPWALEKLGGGVRSEVRVAVAAALGALNGTESLPFEQAEIFLGAYKEQPEAVIAFIEVGSKNPKYLQGDSTVWNGQSFYDEHPDFEDALENQISELIRQTKSRAQERLNNHPQAKITYAFGISLESAASPEDKAPQAVLKYIQMVEELKRANPTAKIEAEIPVLLSEDQMKDERWLPLIKEIQRNSQTAKIYEASSKSVRGEIENFLRRRGNALLYGFSENFIQEEELKSRAVASEIALDSSLPVTFTLTEHLAYGGIRLRPELLGNVIETAHLRGPVRWDGFALTITESAAALVYEVLAAHTAVSSSA